MSQKTLAQKTGSLGIAAFRWYGLPLSAAHGTDESVDLENLIIGTKALVAPPAYGEVN